MSFEISHPDKLWFPRSGVTKGDIIAYYSAIGRVMLPHVKNRVVTLQRFVHGITGDSFYQKNITSELPGFVKTIAIEKADGEVIHEIVIANTKTLLAIANLACISPHVWLSRADKLDRPDRLIFDIDPPAPSMSRGASPQETHTPDAASSFARSQNHKKITQATVRNVERSAHPACATELKRRRKLVEGTAAEYRALTEQFSLAKQVAQLVREKLQARAIEPFVMTTGSRGLHVTVPLRRVHTFEHVRDFARSIAQELAHEHPDLITIEGRKEKRGNRVYIDVLRNGFAQTAVAPYAVRAIEGAPVATPIAWNELDELASAQAFNIDTVLTRIKKFGDVWCFIHRRKYTLR